MFNAMKSYFSDTIVLKNMVIQALKSENEELRNELKIRQKFPIINGNFDKVSAAISVSEIRALDMRDKIYYD